MGKKHLKYSLDQKCFFSALLVCQNMKSFERSFNFLHKLCSFDFPTDMWCILYLRVFIANTKSRAFLVWNVGLKRRAGKRLKAQLSVINPLSGGYVWQRAVLGMIADERSGREENGPIPVFYIYPGRRVCTSLVLCDPRWDFQAQSQSGSGCHQPSNWPTK